MKIGMNKWDWCIWKVENCMPKGPSIDSVIWFWNDQEIQATVNIHRNCYGLNKLILTKLRYENIYDAFYGIMKYFEALFDLGRF